MEKTCLTCGEKLTGRADKKFCNDACKNEFHNQQAALRPSYEKKQRKVARKNRSLLLKIAASGNGEIEMKELELSGFNFEGLTGLKNFGKDMVQLYCYDFILQFQGNSCKIKKWL